MKRLFVLVVAVFIVVVALNRQRLFLRDPLGKVYRNSVELKDARVFINYSNDILVQETDEQHMYVVQHWNKVPGTPKPLTCLSGMMCWTNADHAETAPLEGGRHNPNTQMTDREVSFIDGYGVGVRVTLR